MSEILACIESHSQPDQKLSRIAEVTYGASKEIHALPPCDDNQFENIEKSLRLISCTRVSGKPSYDTLREAREILKKVLKEAQ